MHGEPERRRQAGGERDDQRPLLNGAGGCETEGKCEHETYGRCRSVGAVSGAVAPADAADVGQYPGAAGVVELLKGAGFRTATAHPVLGGLLTIHHARK